MHKAIDTHDSDDLTPYIRRDHDEHLRRSIETLHEHGARSLLLIAVGSSCSGKTRAMYEAILKYLPDWDLIAPKRPSELLRDLEYGIPGGTVIWLDELQEKITSDSVGVNIAGTLDDLIEGVRTPILIAGTIWPENLAHLRQRPSAVAASGGVGDIATLLEKARYIEVAQSFNADSLVHAKFSNDPRVRGAARAGESRPIIRNRDGRLSKYSRGERPLWTAFSPGRSSR